MEHKGCLVEVFKGANGYDCTNGGISANNTDLILIDENGGDLECPFTGDESRVLILVKRDLGGYVYLHCEPLIKPKGMVGPMFGGNFVYTSDSRFPSKYPIPVHDRFETPEQNRSMSI